MWTMNEYEYERNGLPSEGTSRRPEHQVRRLAVRAGFPALTCTKGQWRNLHQGTVALPAWLSDL
jgi:hypothetical protein